MSQFTTIERGEYMTAIEIFDGRTFLSLGLAICGGTMSIHMDPEVATKVAAALLEVVERQKQEVAA